jgi:hypothetical protein
MLTVAVYKSKNEFIKPWLGVFSKGLARHGYKIKKRENGPTVGHLQRHGADIHVFWGMRHAAGILEHCRQTGEVPVCIEHGYTLDRMLFSSINFWGLNGESLLEVPDNDNSRCIKHNWAIHQRDQTRVKNLTLIMGQVTGDMSLKGTNIYAWARKKYAELESHGHKNIQFKPHPKEDPEYLEGFDLPIYHGTMQDAVTEAGSIVTYSSTSAVDAWLNGVPVRAESPVSMIYKYQDDSSADSKTRWLNDISFRQFNKEEFKSGYAWDLCREQLLKK